MQGLIKTINIEDLTPEQIFEMGIQEAHRRNNNCIPMTLNETVVDISEGLVENKA